MAKITIEGLDHDLLPNDAYLPQPTYQIPHFNSYQLVISIRTMKVYDLVS